MDITLRVNSKLFTYVGSLVVKSVLYLVKMVGSFLKVKGKGLLGGTRLQIVVSKWNKQGLKYIYVDKSYIRTRTEKVNRTKNYK